LTSRWALSCRKEPAAVLLLLTNLTTTPLKSGLASGGGSKPQLFLGLRFSFFANAKAQKKQNRKKFFVIL